ncbi:4Fe-4S dicluster domain-containing protein [Natranaerobius thermophilus]|uniref:Heterodisulfide reductase subunit C-like protein n=1 Tax=Natranaerobius thermophilus (strain ATCC BAA-1301 / DSM 18059 / JW/NM-WN-LF) TaxID=457570 RepID=B2A2B2_NATTJ|nr:4Fe-4S dicluster domain-containing protein [Natranaerobius thermophilus]ACB86218.1 Heterodisulfide reductase subunit C-like protein [Natranaerobius thermophilus JW/NM-WN-LF]
MRFPTKTANNREHEELMDITQKNVKDCYQCMKCSAGCPLTEYMDYYPHQIMLRAKMGLYDQVFNSKTLWVCASCMACSSRCPRDLEPAKIMEGFRAMLLRERDQGKVEILDTKGVPRQALIASMRKFRR